MRLIYALKARVWPWRLSEETSLTVLLLLFSLFATGLPRVFTSTATHTVLIDRYGADAIPWAYVLEALLVPLAGYFFVRLESRIPLRTLVIGALGFDLLMLAGLWICYQVPSLSWVAFAGIVWFEVEFALVSLLLWGMASQYMTLGQGKRLFGIVGSGEPIAVIIGGFATVPLLNRMKAADLLLMSGLGVLVGMVLAAILTRRFTAQREGREEAHEEGTESVPHWRIPYVRVLMAVLFFSQLCYFFIDAAFYEQAHHRYPNEKELATFLGMSSAAIGSISLMTGLFVSGPLVRRFGLRSGLLALPGLLLAGAVLVVACGHLAKASQLFFWLVIGNKLIDQALRYTLDKTSSVVLLQPFPASRRNGVQATMESMVEPLAGGVAGAFLIIMAALTGFTALGITHAILVAVVLWVALVFVQHKGYLAALRQALSRRQLEPLEKGDMDEEELGLLRQGLASTRSGEAIYCLNLLASQDALSPELLAAPLAHACPELRQAALNHIEAGERADCAALVAGLLAREQDAAVLGRALAAYGATHADDAVEVIRPYLFASDPRQRLGAYTALLRHGGMEGMLHSGEPLQTLFNSPAPEDKILSARVIEAAALPNLRRPLLRLLQDPAVEVRIAALRAAGRLALPALWPQVLAGLATPGCEPAAVAALSAGGQDALAAIDGFLADPAQPAAARRHAVEAIAAIGGPAALSRLEALIGYPERTVHRAVLRQLNRCAGHCRRERIAHHYPVLEEELRTLAWLLRCREDLAPETGHPAIGLLSSSLAQEADERREGILHLLAFLSPDGGLGQGAHIFRFGSEADRAYLAEAVENQAPKALRPWLSALLTEDRAVGQRRLLGLSRQIPGNAPERLAEIADASAARVTPWLRSCAVHAIASLNLPLPAVFQGRDEADLARGAGKPAFQLEPRPC